MTTVRAVAAGHGVDRRVSRLAVLRLSRTEARRVLLHPVHLALVIAPVLIGGVGDGPAQLFQHPEMVKEALEYIFFLYYGLIVFFAANLVASSSSRTRADSQFDAAPLAVQQRTVAVCLGVLGPVAVASLAAATIYALTYRDAVPLPGASTAEELLAIPLCALGAGLLGVAVARWLRWPGVPLAVAVALVAWVAIAHDHGRWAWSAPWTTSYEFVEQPTFFAGSAGWHAGYLSGLAALAGLAALIRYEDHRRAVITATVVVAGATLVAGFLQLP